jgi:hypothetical protein
MAAFDIPNFVLSYDSFGAGPGAGNSIELRITNIAGVLQVSDELLEDEPGDYRRSVNLSEHAGWRGILRYLAESDIMAFYADGDTSREYPWPDEQQLHGTDCLVTDMVSLAWAGPPVLSVAQALAKIDDSELLRLRQELGSFRERAFIEEMLRLWRWCDETDVELDDIVTKAATARDFDFRQMRRDIVRQAKDIKRQREAAHTLRSNQLAPFADTIKKIVEAWRKANPPTSTNTAIGYGLRSGALLRALEAYAIEHGNLPTGTFRVERTRGSMEISPFDVDINELRGTSTHVSR